MPTPDRFTAENLLALAPQLRRYARALLHDIWLADDLVQDTLERAWDKQSRFAEGTDLRAWLFAIMHNIFVTQVRRSDPLRGAADEHALGGEHARPLGDPVEAMEIVRLFDLLPAEQREVLLLVGVEEFTYGEAARALGVPVGTVMSRLSRAREKLRARIESGEASRPKESANLRVVK